MSTFTQLYCHIVFSTKNREPALSIEWRDELHAYLAGTCHHLGSIHQTIGGVEDHVHCLVVLPKTMSVADFVKHIKRSATQWIRAEQSVTGFHWQEGYGAFSVSSSTVEHVKNYIRNQEEHHKTMSFVDEYRSLLEKVGLSYDERFFP